MSCINLMFSPINLFCTNPFWSLCIILSSVVFNLSAKMPLKYLYVEFNKVIGLHFFYVSSVFPLFLHTGNYSCFLLFCQVFCI